MEKDSQSFGLQQTGGDSNIFWLVRMGAYSVAAVTGIRLGITKIWDMAYDNFKDYSQFNTLRDQRKTDLAQVPKHAKAQGWERKKIAGEIRDIERKYGHDFNEILKRDFKIESEGATGFLKGTVQRFDTLGGYTRAKIGFTAVFSTLAAVGGLVLLERYATGHSPIKQLHDDVQAHAQQSEQARA